MYAFDIPVPANTPESSPVEEEINLTHGVIFWVGVQFPVGCAALAHCRILHRRHQVWPANIDASYASDGYVIPIYPYYDFTEPPYDLTVICWNDDDTYDHTLTIYVDIVPEEILAPFAGMGAMLKEYLKLALGVE